MYINHWTDIVIDYNDIKDLINYKITTIDYVKKVIYHKMIDTIYSLFTKDILEKTSRYDLLCISYLIYEDIHDLNLFLGVQYIDEFDNELIYYISCYFKENFNIDISAKEIANNILENYNKKKIKYYPGQTIASDIANRIYNEFKNSIDTDILNKIIQKIKTTYTKENDVGLKNKIKESHFKIYINNLLKEKNINAATLAKNCDITPQKVSQYTLGERCPSKKTLFKIAIGLHMTQKEINEMFIIAEKDFEFKNEYGQRTLFINNPRDILILKCINESKELKHINYLLARNNMDTI